MNHIKAILNNKRTWSSCINTINGCSFHSLADTGNENKNNLKTKYLFISTVLYHETKIAQAA